MKEQNLKANRVEQHFHGMLQETGIDIQSLNLFWTWQVFKQFLEVPIDCASEGFLFECGLHKYGSDKGAFFVHFVRYYYLEEEEVTWAEMVDCDFEYGFDNELSQFDFTVEASDVNKDKFITQVDAQKQFWATIIHHTAQQSSVYVGCQ
ncbi:MAG: hypothetical protein KY445_03235 [Armatimonadetes bacterium]|nr:hypothetical protein [Armatimonadota bacterium]